MILYKKLQEIDKNKKKKNLKNLGTTYSTRKFIYAEKTFGKNF